MGEIGQVRQCQVSRLVSCQPLRGPGSQHHGTVRSVEVGFTPSGGRATVYLTPSFLSPESFAFGELLLLFGTYKCTA